MLTDAEASCVVLSRRKREQKKAVSAMYIHSFGMPWLACLADVHARAGRKTDRKQSINPSNNLSLFLSLSLSLSVGSSVCLYVRNSERVRQGLAWFGMVWCMTIGIYLVWWETQKRFGVTTGSATEKEGKELLGLI